MSSSSSASVAAPPLSFGVLFSHVESLLLESNSRQTMRQDEMVTLIHSMMSMLSAFGNQLNRMEMRMDRMDSHAANDAAAAAQAKSTGSDCTLLLKDVITNFMTVVQKTLNKETSRKHPNTVNEEEENENSAESVVAASEKHETQSVAFSETCSEREMREETEHEHQQEEVCSVRSGISSQQQQQEMEQEVNSVDEGSIQQQQQEEEMVEEEPQVEEEILEEEIVEEEPEEELIEEDVLPEEEELLEEEEEAQPPTEEELFCENKQFATFYGKEFLIEGEDDQNCLIYRSVHDPLWKEYREACGKVENGKITLVKSTQSKIAGPLFILPFEIDHKDGHLYTREKDGSGQEVFGEQYGMIIDRKPYSLKDIPVSPRENDASPVGNKRKAETSSASGASKVARK